MSVTIVSIDTSWRSVLFTKCRAKVAKQKKKTKKTKKYPTHILVLVAESVGPCRVAASPGPTSHR
jgi:hypothetical protein